VCHVFLVDSNEIKYYIVSMDYSAKYLLGHYNKIKFSSTVILILANHIYYISNNKYANICIIVFSVSSISL